MPFARLATATTPTSRIGLGLAAVGRPGYINLGRDEDLGEDRSIEALRALTHDLLDAAYAQGVRYFDAARSYGRAEEFLADWLQSRTEADDVVIGSKWGYTYTADWVIEAEEHEVKDHSLAAFERQRAESQALLGDRLDLYQIHSLTPDSRKPRSRGSPSASPPAARPRRTPSVPPSPSWSAANPSSVPSSPPTTCWRPPRDPRWPRHTTRGSR